MQTKIYAVYGEGAVTGQMCQKWFEPWVVLLSGLSTNLQTKGSLVWFPLRAHVWVVGQVPSRGRVRGSHTLLFLSLSLSLSPFPCV